MVFWKCTCINVHFTTSLFLESSDQPFHDIAHNNQQKLINNDDHLPISISEFQIASHKEFAIQLYNNEPNLLLKNSFCLLKAWIQSLVYSLIDYWRCFVPSHEQWTSQ